PAVDGVPAHPGRRRVHGLPTAGRTGRSRLDCAGTARGRSAGGSDAGAPRAVGGARHQLPAVGRPAAVAARRHRKPSETQRGPRMSTVQTDVPERGSAAGRGRSRWAPAVSWLRKRLRNPRATPFLLILPALVMLGAIYDYPLLQLVSRSLHDITLPQLIGTKPSKLL